MLYRSMKESPTGAPVPGPGKRLLGCVPTGPLLIVDPNQRPDIRVVAGRVRPGTGGMSVAPDSPYNLPRHRKPPRFGGIAKDPVWEMDEADLGPDLQFVADSLQHGTIQPMREMTIDDYQAALARTASNWRKVT
jgi:hypothetical protein